MYSTEVSVASRGDAQSENLTYIDERLSATATAKRRKKHTWTNHRAGKGNWYTDMGSRRYLRSLEVVSAAYGIERRIKRLSDETILMLEDIQLNTSDVTCEHPSPPVFTCTVCALVVTAIEYHLRVCVSCGFRGQLGGRSIAAAALLLARGANAQVSAPTDVVSGREQMVVVAVLVVLFFVCARALRYHALTLVIGGCRPRRRRRVTTTWRAMSPSQHCRLLSGAWLRRGSIASCASKIARNSHATQLTPWEGATLSSRDLIALFLHLCMNKSLMCGGNIRSAGRALPPSASVSQVLETMIGSLPAYLSLSTQVLCTVARPRLSPRLWSSVRQRGMEWFSPHCRERSDAWPRRGSYAL